jgi:hypothetical protein
MVGGERGIVAKLVGGLTQLADFFPQQMQVPRRVVALCFESAGSVEDTPRHVHQFRKLFDFRGMFHESADHPRVGQNVLAAFDSLFGSQGR